jgi:YjbE family integral membrane protein
MSFWISFINIIIIDIVLSGDNAIVIGMASRKLSGIQRKRAVFWGTIGAIFLRIVLTALATWILLIPHLKAFGGLLLTWIAFKLLISEGEEASDIKAGKNLLSAIKTIIIADFIMSLDNVLAVGGAAHGNLFLVIFGLGLSIPLLMFGSNFIASLMDRLPFLIYCGAAILAHTGGAMIINEKTIQRMISVDYYYLNWIFPLFLTVVLLIVGGWWRRKVLKYG